MQKLPTEYTHHNGALILAHSTIFPRRHAAVISVQRCFGMFTISNPRTIVEPLGKVQYRRMLNGFMIHLLGIKRMVCTFKKFIRV